MNEDDRIEDALAAYKAKIARLGGIARAKRLSAARRKEIATKASKAAARARMKKAKKKGK
jgi:ribosomal protein S21